jgi:hypothetical protein
MLVRMWGKKNPHPRWGWKLVQPLWKSVWRLLKNLKMEQSCSTTPKDCKSTNNRDTCSPMFIAALFTPAKLWNQPSTGKRMKKM